LYFYQFSGNAYGGEIFSSNPTVAVIDRGGNVVNTENTGVVSVSLLQSPSGIETLRPLDKLSIKIESGLAVFKGLYINEVGFPYQMKFECAQVSLIFCTVSNYYRYPVASVYICIDSSSIYDCLVWILSSIIKSVPCCDR
jgi:hypothetical protein